MKQHRPLQPLSSLLAVVAVGLCLQGVDGPSSHDKKRKKKEERVIFFVSSCPCSCSCDKIEVCFCKERWCVSLRTSQPKDAGKIPPEMQETQLSSPASARSRKAHGRQADKEKNRISTQEVTSNKKKKKKKEESRKKLTLLSFQTVARESIKWSIISLVWKGVGVTLSLSVPMATVG